jgi:hypothetical protein
MSLVGGPMNVNAQAGLVVARTTVAKTIVLVIGLSSQFTVSPQQSTIDGRKSQISWFALVGLRLKF